MSRDSNRDFGSGRAPSRPHPWRVRVFTATLDLSAALVGGEVANILRGRAPAPSEAPRAEQGNAVADR